MKPLLIAAGVLIACLQNASAQSLDALNIQLHGYATQAFIYSNHNSWNTTDSENGSASWTEAVVNLGAQPEPKLRIGVQARFFLLGDYGNSISLDWAQADYKFNEHFGVRVGKVKTPGGLFNESQDIDPAQLWVLLPESIYPIASRNSVLAHYGGVFYGSVPVGETFGKLEYRGFGGQEVLGSNDPYLGSLRDQGVTVPNGVTGQTFGATLRWLLPVRGLMLGASERTIALGGELDAGPYTGTITLPRVYDGFFFGKYERNRIMVAAEYTRVPAIYSLQLLGAPAIISRADQRPWYAMASYKVTSKLSGGLYYSSFLDRQAAFTSARYQKDWALAARYDFSPFLYAKAEQHWIDGTAIGFAASDNPDLQPTTRMTMLKLGVSF